MRRLALFSATAVLAFPFVAGSQAVVTLENGRWTRTFKGTAPAAARLRVNAHGPVTLAGAASPAFVYEVKVSVTARTEAAARRVLQIYSIRTESQAGWLVLTTPGGPVETRVSVQAPKLVAAILSTTDGPVNAVGVEGELEVETGGGNLMVDRVGGDCRLFTGGGDMEIGEIGGGLQATTGAGGIHARLVRGQAVLETNGGDIVAGEVGGAVRAETGGGGVRIGSAGGAVSAVSGGGQIVVEKAAGTVTLRNMAGAVQVGSAAGVRCESGSGGISLARITGPMRVSTSMGNIVANLLGSKLADSFLATGSGDITVLIPSNLGVTIQAQNDRADTLRRITSDYPQVRVRRQGTRLVAAGVVNGGGPLLQITGMGGTIYIKRQR
jgi:hypothetical protein